MTGNAKRDGDRKKLWLPYGLTGQRGCCMQTKRRGTTLRPCSQQAEHKTADGRTWCRFHKPVEE